MSFAVVDSRRAPGSSGADVPTQALVCWQNPESRAYRAIGMLSATPDGYAFAYLPHAKDVSGFSPLLGFPSLDHVYRSAHLFPIFSQRIMLDSRREQPKLLDALALGAHAQPLEVLVRSGGHRAGDTLELLPVPTIVNGETEFLVLVHGVRYCDGADAAISGLRRDDELTLQLEPHNPKDPQAVLVTRLGLALGWVPQPLLSLTHAMLEAAEPRVSVVRVNPHSLGHHLRLLIRVQGPVSSGYVSPWGSETE